MNPELIIALIQLAELAAQHVPALIQDVAQLKDLLTSGREPTEDDMAAIRSAQQKSHEGLQDAITAKIGPV